MGTVKRGHGWPRQGGPVGGGEGVIKNRPGGASGNFGSNFGHFRLNFGPKRLFFAQKAQKCLYLSRKGHFKAKKNDIWAKKAKFWVKKANFLSKIPKFSGKKAKIRRPRRGVAVLVTRGVVFGASGGVTTPIPPVPTYGHGRQLMGGQG